MVEKRGRRVAGRMAGRMEVDARVNAPVDRGMDQMGPDDGDIVRHL